MCGQCDKNVTKGGKKGGKTYLERAEEALVHTHHGTRIVKLSTVIGSTEESDQLSLGEELIAVLDHLMCSADQVHVMLLQEPRHHIRAKGEGHTPVILTPTGNIFFRIRPQQVTE